MSKKIAVIGGGLIGGSLAAGLKKRSTEWEITCLDLPGAVAEIEESGIFHSVHSSSEMGIVLPDCDVVVLATTVDSIVKLLDTIGPHLKKGAIITDVGSTKTDITNKAAEVLPKNVCFVGGHPITGSEQSGIAAADPFLFKNKPYVLCPDQSGDENGFLTVMNLVEQLGGIPISIEPDEHDMIFAMVSHAPQLVAVAMMNAARKLDSTHGILDLVAGSGFLDMTRIAASNFDVWKSILESNRIAVASALDAFLESLSDLRTSLVEGDPTPVWEPARRRRKEMQPKRPNRDCERDLRNQIDALDAQLLKIVHRRFEVVKKIGEVKKKKELPVFDAKREERVRQHWSEYGDAFGLTDDFMKDLFGVLTDHAKRLQA